MGSQCLWVLRTILCTRASSGNGEGGMREKEAADYSEAERFLSEVPMFTTKNPLEETRGFYHFVQYEIHEESLGKIIHVAGTNGKGSVCAFLNQVFLESGYHVGLFTSPHLVTTRERFMIDGDMVSEDAFVEAFNWLFAKINAYRALANDYTPTYFERLFFMGMYLFAKAEVEVTVLETGLGGRLDTTNVIKNPALCIITEIGLDHVAYLGDTIARIASEKAGIIKPNVPVVFLERKKEASDVLTKKASECGCVCHVVSKKDYKINEIKKKCIDFSVVSRYYDYDDVRHDDIRHVRMILNTSALYQAENAAIAVRACEVLMRECGFDRLHVKEGIEKMRWPGRMEEVVPNVYIDGAHNEDGIEAFVDSLKNAVDLESCILIFSVVKDKRYDKMIEQLCSLEMVTEFVLTHIPDERGAELRVLAEQFRDYTDKEIRVFEQIEDAVLYCLEKRNRLAQDIYIVGSLYLAGAVRELLDYQNGVKRNALEGRKG